jgi:hypothetical protein
VELLDRSSPPKILPLGNKSRKKPEPADIGYPPRRLMIHLIWPSCVRDVTYKDGQEIRFPETVKMSQFMAEEAGLDKYRLTFLASHIGITMMRNHSRAEHFVRSKKNG